MTIIMNHVRNIFIQPLDDLFTGMKVYIDPSIVKANEVERYIIRYESICNYEY